MKHITSLDNSLIKAVTKLKTKKGRESAQQFLAEGIRTCKTIIQSGIKPLHIFSTQEMFSKISFLINQDYQINIIPHKIIKKISPVVTPSGLICVFPIPAQLPYNAIKEGMVLAYIQDPGNMGTLIRTCVSFGKKTVILIEGVDPWSPKVVQASAGTIAMAHIFRISWHDLLAYRGNLKLIALVVENGKNPSKINFENSLLIIGGEAHGIPDSWLKNCDNLMTIPMPGETESLNAATAGAIAMYLTWVQN